ncbi:MAG TPA: hypothetical protein PK006_08535 [Saprospiraceae bacterium]|nr:hypothetical protein [Saprospiraceae bacterium]
MKKIKLFLFAVFSWGLLGLPLGATQLPTATLGGVTVKGINVTPEQVADILIFEAMKLNIYDITNRHDVNFLAKEAKIDLMNCLSKQCLVQIGQLAKQDHVLTASVELFGNRIFISVRDIHVASSSVEKTNSMEFLNVESELNQMISCVLHRMYGVPFDEFLEKKLTSEQTLENKIQNPAKNQLNLSGPRFGFAYTAGPDGKSIHRTEAQGGIGTFPMLSQFGYQFEIAYLNEGTTQGLFEILPIVSGIEHGVFIPSLSLMHGVRSNKTGLEFSIGPNFTLSKRNLGYYDANGNWVVASGESENNGNVSKEIDRRGKMMIEGGLVIAFGKSYRSGSVKFPFNIYTVLKKDSPRFGISMGFNSKKL